VDLCETMPRTSFFSSFCATFFLSHNANDNQRQNFLLIFSFYDAINTSSHKMKKFFFYKRNLQRTLMFLKSFQPIFAPSFIFLFYSISRQVISSFFWCCTKLNLFLPFQSLTFWIEGLMFVSALYGKNLVNGDWKEDHAGFFCWPFRLTQGKSLKCFFPNHFSSLVTFSVTEINVLIRMKEEEEEEMA
jgi:hypothetical protein